MTFLCSSSPWPSCSTTKASTQPPCAGGWRSAIVARMEQGTTSTKLLQPSAHRNLRQQSMEMRQRLRLSQLNHPKQRPQDPAEARKHAAVMREPTFTKQPNAAAKPRPVPAAPSCSSYRRQAHLGRPPTALQGYSITLMATGLAKSSSKPKSARFITSIGALLRLGQAEDRVLSRPGLGHICCPGVEPDSSFVVTILTSVRRFACPCVAFGLANRVSSFMQPPASRHCLQMLS